MSDSEVEKRYLQWMFIPPLITMAIFTLWGLIAGKALGWIAAAVAITVPPACFWALFVYVVYLVFGRRVRPTSHSRSQAVN